MPRATDQPEDIGLYGRRASPPRLAPSLVSIVNSAPSVPVPIPEGTALIITLGSVAAAGASVALTINRGAAGSFNISIGPQAEVFLRSADGFTSATWTASSVLAMLVVDTGAYPSSIVSSRIYATQAVSGTVTVTPPVNMGNGTAAPNDGVVTVTLKATASSVVTLTDGTNTADLVASATGQWETHTFAVKSGVTYTLSGTLLVLLGGVMVVGAG